MKKLRGRPVLILLCLLFAALMVHTTWCAAGIIDSDAVSELMLARQVHQEGVVVSHNWYYSTDIKVLCDQLVFAPLFSVFSDWRTIRFVGSLIQQGILLACFAFLLRSLKASPRRTLLGCLLLGLPVSVGWGRVTLYHCFYIPYLAVAFLLLGLYRRYLRGGSRKRQYLRGCGMAVLSFIAGLSGMRHLMWTTAPLLASAALDLLLENRPLTGKRLKRLLPLLWHLVPLVLGYAVFAGVLCREFTITNHYDGRLITLISAQRLQELVSAFLKAFGFAEDVPLLSLNGIVCVLGAAAAVLSLPAALLGLRRQEDEKRFACLFYLMGLLVNAAVFILIDSSEDYFPCYALIPVCYAIPMLVLPGKAEKPLPVRRLISWLCAVALLLSGVVTTGFFRDPEHSTLTWEGLPNSDPLLSSELQGAADYASSQGWTLGCAVGEDSYWYSAVITELTDGEISMVCLEDGEEGIRNYLRSAWILPDADSLEPDTFFVITRHTEDGPLDELGLRDALTEVWQDGFCTLYTCADPKAAFGGYVNKEASK